MKAQLGKPTGLALALLATLLATFLQWVSSPWLKRKRTQR